MLATHPNHRCHYAHHGFAIACAPPWHFFGWFGERNAPAMREAARATGTRLRIGERRSVRPGGSPNVEVWVHEDVTSLAHFWDTYWDTYYAQHPELRWGGEPDALY